MVLWYACVYFQIKMILSLMFQFYVLIKMQRLMLWKRTWTSVEFYIILPSTR
jgi:hypothetical protein